ncbi:MAG: nitrogen fixation protein NifB [Spirochaetes bacterium GWD1_27_9]|nr:MAG: nitrogen fixation protein NifB [Spirochaetes bacterium GWB1_27_13]OHD30998.1 MAG: nitrogen fixation protein NifB [Spirochaetes bacterium GWD1_27_9]
MNLENHPCFNDKLRHQFGRIHLPVAPKCNIQCNYCDRKYDCMNESRPGVTSVVLTPKQSIVYLEKILEKNSNISVVGIAGPGDPFANPEETMETLRLVRQKYPNMLLCLATNGLNLLPYIDELAELKISHVTITINAIFPEIASKIYAWVRDAKKVYRGLDAAKLIIERQLEGIKRLKEKNIVVKINTIIIPTINEDHIIDVVKEVSLLGADIINCIPIHPNKDTVFENIPEPDKVSIHKIRKEAEKYIPQMHHCTRCRADAVGLIEEQMSEKNFDILKESSMLSLNPEDKKPYIAVTSMEGVLVNQHLGEAKEVLIYSYENKKPNLIEKRSTPDSGSGNKRWIDFAEIIKDCSAVIVNGAGDNPKNIFYEQGIKVVVTEGMIDDILENYFNGKPLKSYKKREGCSKGIECSGNGTGCG